MITYYDVRVFKRKFKSNFFVNVCRVSPFSRSDFTSLSFHFLALSKKNYYLALFPKITLWPCIKHVLFGNCH